MTAHNARACKSCAVIAGVNELRGSHKRVIAPPRQEGWREAPGWLFRRRFLNNHPVCAVSEAARFFLIAQPAPPIQEGRFVASKVRRFIHTFIDRAYTLAFLTG